MNKVTTYEDLNGDLHKTEAGCARANANILAEKTFMSNGSLSSGALQVSNWYEFSKWFDVNRKWLMPALGVIDNE